MQVKAMSDGVREETDAVKAKRANVGKVKFVAAGDGGSGSSSYHAGDRRRASDYGSGSWGSHNQGKRSRFN